MQAMPHAESGQHQRTPHQKQHLPAGPQPRPAAEACILCGHPLRQSPPAGRPALCHAVTCRMLLERLERLTPSQRERQLTQAVRNARAVSTHMRESAAQLARKLGAEEAENTALWAAAQQHLGPVDGQRWLRLKLPSGRRPRINLAQARRTRYRDHLGTIIAQAAALRRAASAAPAPAGPTMPDAADEMAVGLCTVCAGGCCTGGGDTAYLTPETIARYMRDHPALRPRDVLAAYLERLAGKVQANSCINHTATGCGLPAGMRSDVCNRYGCSSFEQLRREAGSPQPPAAVLVVVRRQDNWHQERTELANDVVAMALVRPRSILALDPATGTRADRSATP